MAGQKRQKGQGNNKKGATKKASSGKMTVKEAGHLGGQKERSLVEKGQQREGKKGRAA